MYPLDLDLTETETGEYLESLVYLDAFNNQWLDVVTDMPYEGGC